MTWTVRVLKWNEFQHYKTRNPPWIKLHRRLLDKREWRLLSAPAAKLLVDLWILAAENEGEIRLSLGDLAWRLRLGEGAMLADLQILAASSFIEVRKQDASAPLARRMRDAMPETEAETDPEVVKISTATQSVNRAGRSADRRQDVTDGQLMQAVRRFLYIPDGQPPTGYDDGRCMQVIRALRKQRYSGPDILTAIEGLAILRDRGDLDWLPPGAKSTMRALYNTRSGVRPVFMLAQEAAFKAGSVPRETPGKPQRLDATAALRKLGVPA